MFGSGRGGNSDTFDQLPGGRPVIEKMGPQHWHCQPFAVDDAVRCRSLPSHQRRLTGQSWKGEMVVDGENDDVDDDAVDDEKKMAAKQTQSALDTTHDTLCRLCARAHSFSLSLTHSLPRGSSNAFPRQFRQPFDVSARLCVM